MRTLLDSLGAAAVLWAVAWVVVIGVIGAALGAARADRPMLGFVVAVLVPLPIVGWLIVIGLTSRHSPVVASDNPFQSMIDEVSDEPG